MIKSLPSYFFLLLGLSIVLISCEKREYETIEQLDSKNINAYIATNNLNVTQYKDTDLFYEIVQEGTGDPLNYRKAYPIVFTVKSLDGKYLATDTFELTNRYYDFLGYFPFGNQSAGTPNSPVERINDLKDVVHDVLKFSHGKIRIIVPSRLTTWGRQGNRELGIPPNASLDYTISVHDDLKEYEDAVIQKAIVNAGFQLDEFEKTTDDIYYKIITPGTGDIITADSTVRATYTLRNAAGEKMESAEEYRISLAGGSIPAWTKMIPLIRKGGKIRFFTPSFQAYGPSGSNTTAPFLQLDFEVEIVR